MIVEKLSKLLVEANPKKFTASSFKENAEKQEPLALDSLTTFEFAALIEESTGIALMDEELDDIKHPAKLVNILESRLADK